MHFLFCFYEFRVKLQNSICNNVKKLRLNKPRMISELYRSLIPRVFSYGSFLFLMALIILLLSEANGSCLICCPERMTITTKDRVALHHFCCCRLYPSYGFFQYFGRSLPYSSSMLLHVSEQQFPVYFLSSLLLQGLYFSLFWK